MFFIASAAAPTPTTAITASPSTSASSACWCSSSDSWCIAVLGGAFQSAYLGGLLDIADGKPVEIGTFFKPRNVVNVVIASLLIGVASAIGSIVFIGSAVVALFTLFAVVILVERNLSAIDGIKASFEIVKANFVQVLLTYLIVAVIISVGAFLCGIGLFVALPVAALYLVYAYRTLTAARSRRLRHKTPEFLSCTRGSTRPTTKRGVSVTQPPPPPGNPPPPPPPGGPDTTRRPGGGYQPPPPPPAGGGYPPPPPPPGCGGYQPPPPPVAGYPPPPPPQGGYAPAASRRWRRRRPTDRCLHPVVDPRARVAHRLRARRRSSAASALILLLSTQGVHQPLRGVRRHRRRLLRRHRGLRGEHARSAVGAVDLRASRPWRSRCGTTATSRARPARASARAS